MIPMIQEQVVSKGWISESNLTDFIAVSEATPGPFAINISTFVGNSVGGVFGAICSTIGVILPSIIIILIIAMIMKKFMKKIAIGLTAMMMTFSLAACGDKKEETTAAGSQDAAQKQKEDAFVFHSLFSAKKRKKQEPRDQNRVFSRGRSSQKYVFIRFCFFICRS